MANATWHDYPSNFSGNTSVVDGVGKMFQYSNHETGGMLGYMIVGMILIISFVLAKTTVSAGKAFAASSFITFLISIFLLRIELVNFMVPIVLMLCTVASIILTRNEEQRGL